MSGLCDDAGYGIYDVPLQIKTQNLQRRGGCPHPPAKNPNAKPILLDFALGLIFNFYPVTILSKIPVSFAIAIP